MFAGNAFAWPPFAGTIGGRTPVRVPGFISGYVIAAAAAEGVAFAAYAAEGLVRPSAAAEGIAVADAAAEAIDRPAAAAELRDEQGGYPTGS